uniref:Uncharacterized protein n=1 Tax=Sphaerodactylus townsendi TaxID=933632 RepID=A0ACB8EKV5_9SAUR
MHGKAPPPQFAEDTIPVPPPTCPVGSSIKRLCLEVQMVILRCNWGEGEGVGQSQPWPLHPGGFPLPLFHLPKIQKRIMIFLSRKETEDTTYSCLVRINRMEKTEGGKGQVGEWQRQEEKGEKAEAEMGQKAKMQL